MAGTLALLALSTLASEDLACVAAGALIARGDVAPAAGVVACALGIFAGDCGLWALGRFGKRIAGAWPWIERRLAAAVTVNERWPAGHAAVVLIGSRFTPGTRLPLYVGAGLLGMPFRRFAIWTGVAAALWTPAIVLASARAGEAGADASNSSVWTVALALAAVVVLGRAAGAVVATSRAATSRAAMCRHTLARYRRWEFWPPWLFYLPVVGWVAFLAVRYRGLSAITTCNPGIPDGGVVGESKSRILAALQPQYTIPHLLLPAGEPDRLAMAVRHMAITGWTFPVILKPDVGQRGAGVRLIGSIEQIGSYLTTMAGAVLMQPFHEGPYEAGVFYFRFPDEPRGRILSITDKHFPVVTGDGSSTLRQLIDAHPRCRLQSPLFLARHADIADTVLARGERLQLAIAGNHAQGTTFRDGAHLWTAALEHRIDAIARQYPGFFVGRFDVRYRDVGAFMAGRDLAIVELNGATAEATDVYDPENTLVAAYRALFRQWSLVFAIGAANKARGARPTSMRRMIALVWRHLTVPTALPLAD